MTLPSEVTIHEVGEVEDDLPVYNGLWGTYPYFPSGTVIGSDIEKGLFVWTIDSVFIPTAPRLVLFVFAALLVGATLAIEIRTRTRWRASEPTRGTR